MFASRRPVMRMPRILGPLETWGCGFTGLLLWFLVAPDVQAPLGPQTLFMWVPVAVVGVLFTLQVKRLAAHWPEPSAERRPEELKREYANDQRLSWRAWST